MAEPSSAGIEHSDYEARSRATRQRLLDVAVEVLADSGYAGASTLRIQQRAGVSRGRLLHQYPHRDALLVAAVQHLADARLGEDAEARWPADPAERIDAAVAGMWANYRQPYFWAATELWLAARHNAALAEVLAPNERNLGVRIRASADAMFGATLAGHPRYPALRDLLNTSMRGVALTYAFDPRDAETDPHVSMWQDLARRELGVD